MKRCGIVERYTILRASVSRGLSQARLRPDFSPFDIVLLDLAVRDGQGMEAIRRIRDVAPGVPLVAMTHVDDTSLAAVRAYKKDMKAAAKAAS